MLLHAVEPLLIVNLFGKFSVKPVLRVQRLSQWDVATGVRASIRHVLGQKMRLSLQRVLSRYSSNDLAEMAKHTAPYSVFNHLDSLCPLLKQMLGPDFGDVGLQSLVDQILLTSHLQSLGENLEEHACLLAVLGQRPVTVEC